MTCIHFYTHKEDISSILDLNIITKKHFYIFVTKTFDLKNIDLLFRTYSDNIYNLTETIAAIIFTAYNFIHNLYAISHLLLTLNLQNFLNGIIHLTYFALSIIIFRDIKMRT